MHKQDDSAMSKIYQIHVSEIDTFLNEFVAKLKGGEILALEGPLGAGKTTFTQALGKKLGVTKKITSPTYILLQSFPGKLPSKKAVTLHHLDLYRTKDYKEVQALGIEEFWSLPDSITVIEWADKIKNKLPKNTIYVNFAQQN
jgi:tRNA threonylcarbamoyladenosine biosynthesis protein TsaE